MPAAIGITAAAGGGYFPTSWGWAALVFSWIAILALLFRAEVHVSVLEWAAVAAICGVAAWTALSILWSADVTQTVLEFQRSLVYVSGVLALVSVARRRLYRELLGGLLVAISLVSAYGLATRLFPERLGVYDPVATYRLAEPVGYWNALGILAAIGALLALGFAAHGDGYATRALSGAAVVVLVATLYFTFGRGPWIALIGGLLATIVFETRRLRFVTTVLVLSPFLVATVWLASNSTALTRQATPLQEASRAGHRLAVAVILLCLGAAVAATVLHALGPRLRIPAAVRVAYAAALALVAVVALAVLVVRFGTPVTIATDAYEEFKGPPVGISEPGADLSQRLLNLSGNGRFYFWSAAWDGFRADPWLGSGAGTYEQYWLQHRPFDGKIRDAHSLYAETLAELGLVGMLLLAAALLVPLLAAVRAARRRFVPAAVGAYLAFVAHAGVDWDWEMPVVVLAGLTCGFAIIVAARSPEHGATSRRVRLAVASVAVALAAVSFVGLVGNIALSDAADAIAASDWGKAESDAHRASRWAPWSSQPWQLLGQAKLAEGDRPAARRAFLKAIEKDRRNWELWFGLAGASDGEQQRAAFRQAWRLNPFTRGPVTAVHED